MLNNLFSIRYFIIFDIKRDRKSQGILKIDCANGVGAKKLEILKERLGDILTMEIYNDGGSGQLNYKCGADYVKVNQKGPDNMIIKANERYCSLDGDADRLVYYYKDESTLIR